MVYQIWEDGGDAIFEVGFKEQVKYVSARRSPYISRHSLARIICIIYRPTQPKYLPLPTDLPTAK